MSKTLSTLLQKAFRTGYANLNGRMSYGCCGETGELESKWLFEYDQDTDRLKLSHWGTLILEIGAINNTQPVVFNCLVTSKSDRDAIQFVFNYLELTGYSVRYLPSKHLGVITANFGDGQIVTKIV